MTTNTKTEATVLGNILLKRLKGKGWSLRVWENQGYHYSIEHKRRHLSVWPSSIDGTFYCHLQPSYAFWCDSRSFRDPNRAVTAAISCGRKAINPMLAIVQDAEKV